MDFLWVLLAINLGTGLGLLYNWAMSPLYRKAHDWIHKQLGD